MNTSSTGLPTEDEARANVEEYTRRLVRLMMNKKEIDNDIKALKQEFKEEGVPVSLVTRIVNKIKANKKKTDSELFEEDVINSWLTDNAEIDSSIGDLND